MNVLTDERGGEEREQLEEAARWIETGGSVAGRPDLAAFLRNLAESPRGEECELSSLEKQILDLDGFELGANHVASVLRISEDQAESTMRSMAERGLLERSRLNYRVPTQPDYGTGEPDISPGDVIAAEVDGTIVLDDGVTTWNPSRATAFLVQAAHEYERSKVREKLEAQRIKEQRVPSAYSSGAARGLSIAIDLLAPLATQPDDGYNPNVDGHWSGSQGGAGEKPPGSREWFSEVLERVRPLFDAIDSPDGEIPPFQPISDEAQRAYGYLYLGANPCGEKPVESGEGERPPRSHELKTRPPYFESIITGEKTFELRADDRGGFVAGDTLLLREWDALKRLAVKEAYTGRAIRARVDYVLYPALVPAFGFRSDKDWAVMAITPELPEDECCLACAALKVGAALPSEPVETQVAEGGEETEDDIRGVERLADELVGREDLFNEEGEQLEHHWPMVDDLAWSLYRLSGAPEFRRRLASTQHVSTHGLVEKEKLLGEEAVEAAAKALFNSSPRELDVNYVWGLGETGLLLGEEVCDEYRKTARNALEAALSETSSPVGDPESGEAKEDGDWLQRQAARRWPGIPGRWSYEVRFYGGNLFEFPAPDLLDATQLAAEMGRVVSVKELGPVESTNKEEGTEHGD